MTPSGAADPAPSVFSIVLYRDQESAGDPRPIATTWENLVALLTTGAETSPCTAADGLRKCVGKKCPYKSHSALPPDPNNFMCWSPVELVTGARRRLDSNVCGVTALVLDYDHLEPAVAEAVRAAYEGWDHIVHTTHNHRPHDHCLRVVVRLSRPVVANQWHRFLRASIEFVGVSATTFDKKGKPVTTGDTPEVKDRDTGVLGRILGY